MNDDLEFYGIWTHNKTGNKYEAGGIVSVKTRDGNWDKCVIYRNLKTGIEYGRNVHNFKARFTKEGTQ